MTSEAPQGSNTWPGAGSKVGGVVSMVCRVWVTEVALPQASVAVQVRVNVAVVPHPGTEVSVKDRVTSPQLSVATGVSRGRGSPQATTASAGTARNTGASASSVVTVWVYVAAFPLQSVADQVRV